MNWKKIIWRSLINKRLEMHIGQSFYMLAEWLPDFKSHRTHFWPGGLLHFTVIVRCIVGKLNSIHTCLLRMSRPRNQHSNRNLKGDKERHIPNVIILLFPYEKCSPGSWRWWCAWPLGETSALWGGRLKEELREGPRVGSGFSSSLSNEKKDDVMEGKMVPLLRELCDREVSQEPQARMLTRGYEISTFILLFKDDHKVDMEHTGIRGASEGSGVSWQTVGHIWPLAAPACILKR